MSEKIKFHLRKATPSDLLNILDLSKEEDFREKSLYTEPTNWEDQKAWYTERLHTEDFLILVAEDENNRFMGRVQYELIRNQAIVSISIAPDFRGLDLAAPIIEESARFLFSNNDKIESIIAYIKEINIPSLKAFEQAGYIYYKQEIIDDTIFLVYRFLRN